MNALIEAIEAVSSGRERFAVVCGDSHVLLQTLADRAVDVVLTDPPYDAKTHNGAMTMKGRKGCKLEIGFDPLKGMQHVPELIRVANRWVLAFCALEQLGAYQAAAGPAWVRAGIWDRTGGMPQISGDRPAQGAEGIAIMHRTGRKSWNGGGTRGVWSACPVRVERVHETEKPIGLMLKLVELFTAKDEIVLDPFMGGGTTGEACMHLSRRFVGIELTQAHAMQSRDRIARASVCTTREALRAGQLGLFNG